MGVLLELPEDVRGRIEVEAEDRGWTVDYLVVIALRQWLEGIALQQREELIGALLAQGGLHRGTPPAGAPSDWQPRDLPGRPLSEIVIEERGPR